MWLTDEQSEEEKKAEETALFTKYYTEWKGGGDKDSSYKNIPRFYYRVITFLAINVMYGLVGKINFKSWIWYYSFQLKMKFFSKSWEKNPELCFFKEKVENCLITRNYK